MKATLSRFSFILALVFLSFTAKAALLAYEGFNYETSVVGTLSGLQGGEPVCDVGWAGAWGHEYISTKDASSAISLGSVNKTGVRSTGNKAFSIAGSGVNWERRFAGPKERFGLDSFMPPTRRRRPAPFSFKTVQGKQGFRSLLLFPRTATSSSAPSTLEKYPERISIFSCSKCLFRLMATRSRCGSIRI